MKHRNNIAVDYKNGNRLGRRSRSFKKIFHFPSFQQKISNSILIFFWGGGGGVWVEGNLQFPYYNALKSP